MLNCSKVQPILTPVGDPSVMWFMVVMMPIVALLGIVGNIFSFIILKHCSKKVSSFFYIRCLTVFDSLALIFTISGFYTVLVIHPVLLKSKWYAEISDMWVRWGTCQFRTYMAFSCRSLSVWTIVIFTVERCIGIRFPMLSIKICTVPFAKVVVAILVPVCFLCNLTWVFSFKKRIGPCKKYTLCQPREFMLDFRIIDFFMLTLVPATIIMFCNVVIIISLRQRRHLSLVAFEEPKNKARDRKIVMQLLSVSFTFVVLTLPILISTIINTTHDKIKSTAHLSGNLANFYHTAMLLFTVNFAINFCLYCLIGKNFRYGAYSLLCCNIEDMRMYRDALFETVSDTKSLSVKSSTHKINIPAGPESDRLLMVKLSNQLQRPDTEV